MIDTPKYSTPDPVIQALRLADAKFSPPHLPAPNLVPDGFISIETALTVLGSTIHGDKWTGTELEAICRMPLESVRAHFDHVLSIPDFAPVHDGLVEQALLLPEAQSRWRDTVDRLLQFLYDDWTYAIDPSKPNRRKLPRTLWAAPKRGRVLIEEGELELGDHVLKAVIHSETFSIATAAAVSGVDVENAAQIAADQNAQEIRHGSDRALPTIESTDQPSHSSEPRGNRIRIRLRTMTGKDGSAPKGGCDNTWSDHFRNEIDQASFREIWREEFPERRGHRGRPSEP